jgi:hypothetical protein
MYERRQRFEQEPARFVVEGETAANADGAALAATETDDVSMNARPSTGLAFTSLAKQ